MTIDLIAWRLVRRPVIFLGALGLAIALGFLGLFLAGMVTQASHSTFTVNSTGDAADASAGDGTCETATSGECTLRAAIEEANAHAGADTIAFDIVVATDAGCNGVTDVCTISPGSFLPGITKPVIIDGYTQPGASENTNPEGQGLNTVIKIELDGSLAGAANGLGIVGGGTTVKGLAIGRFEIYGISIATSGGNTIEGNFVGTDATGLLDRGNDFAGILVRTGSNAIGGTAPAARNILSGNFLAGVTISTASATSNTIEGNLIGTDITGVVSLGNTRQGVRIIGHASGNTIGGTASGAGNVLSGNGAHGVHLGSSATGNFVEGNLIGTTPDGQTALANSVDGIFIQEGASSNTIGGTAAEAGNVISGNNNTGIRITNNNTTGNVVQGNLIGTDIDGTSPLGNGNAGISFPGSPSGPLFDATDNLIGGTAPGAGNVISANVIGVGLGSALGGNTVQGNLIGTDVTGTVALGNDTVGVGIGDSPGNTIGGSAAGAGNVISGNSSYGVQISGSAATGNDVQGNLIGTQTDGTSPLGNTSHGVYIFGDAHDNDVGGAGAGEGSTIAFNGGDGVRVDGALTTGNTVRGNSIHSNSGNGIENTAGGNAELAPPVITAVSSASGTACNNCTVDVYSDSLSEGRLYHGSDVADGSGSWSFAGLVSGPNVTATATDAIGNTSEFSLPTPVGNTTVGGVAIPLDDGVTITFSTVTGGGTTTVTTSTAGAPPPTGLKIVGFGGQPVYYEITTTATFTGLVTVCIAYDETLVEAAGQESNLKLMHDDGSGFTDITSSLDTINNIICGETATLSPFALMVPIPPEGPPVGGIVELRTGSDAPASAGAGSGSSASLYAAVVGAIAAGTLALAAGGMYLRRRRVG